MDDVEGWVKKLEGLRKGEVDLSSDEDLSVALMNLISLEEHLYFTAVKTGDRKYLGMLDSVRQLRKRLMKRIVANPQGEEWCISKHLLAASMRLVEVGTKELARKSGDADALFRAAFELHSLFFAINVKAAGVKEFREAMHAPESADGGMMSRLSAVMSKIVNCCKE